MQEIKESIATQEGENPEFNSTLLGRKSKEHSKKKKEFKIKKLKLNGGKKVRKEEGFSNPLYAGLDTEDMEDENRLNFGPWIKEDISMESNESKGNNLTNLNRYNNFETDRINNENESIIGSNNRYEQEPNRHNRTSTHDLRFMETKNKREFQELRCSSLMLEISNKSGTLLSPLKQKPLKTSKESQLNKLTKSKSSSVELLKYNSMKYLFPNSEKVIDSPNVVVKRPNAVIYNYCCSSYDNNLFSNELDTLLLNKGQQNSSRTSNNNELRQQFSYKEKGNVSNKSITLRETQTLLPIKKSINRELYDELIKKKSKIK